MSAKLEHLIRKTLDTLAYSAPEMINQHVASAMRRAAGMQRADDIAWLRARADSSTSVGARRVILLGAALDLEASPDPAADVAEARAAEARRKAQRRKRTTR